MGVIEESTAWRHIAAPSEQDIEALSKEYNLPTYYFEGVSDLDEPSRLERLANGLFIIIDFPYVKRVENDLNLYDTFPISILINNGKMITITAAHHEFIEEFRNRYGKDDQLEKKPGIIAMQLLQYIMKSYIRDLREIREDLTHIEDRFLKRVYNEDFRKLFTLEKSIIHIKTALTGFNSMLNKMSERQYLQIETDSEMELLFDNVQIESQQASEMATIYREVLSSAMDVASSLVSNTLNQIMKRLTSVTIIISIPTLITGFFGMNVGLPFQDLSIAVLIIVVISVILCYLTVLYLRRKDLL